MIPFFDYRRSDQPLREEIERVMRGVLDSGQLILGPEVSAFEREFAAYTGVPHAVGCASGTDALILALRALEVGPGDEVVTVANAGVPPVAAIRAAGALPRFVDVDPETLLMDPRRLEAALTPRTRCVLPVHLYGQPAALDAILEVARARRLSVIEDCAQAHGARLRGEHVGGFGDIGCFSFYPTKNLGAYGDGGMCITRDGALADRLRELRMYGFRDDRHAHGEGLNSRLDELQAAILRVKLRHLDSAVEVRRGIAQRYLDGLKGSTYGLPTRSKGTEHAYHLFVIRTRERQRVAEGLQRAQIGCGIHYPEPVHAMQAYRFLEVPSPGLAVTEQACDEVLSLPIYPGLEAAELDRVIEGLSGHG